MCTFVSVYTYARHTVGRDAIEVAREIVETVTDPTAMIGPEVSTKCVFILPCIFFSLQGMLSLSSLKNHKIYIIVR